MRTHTHMLLWPCDLGAASQILEMLGDYAHLGYGDAIDALCRDLGAQRYINIHHPRSGLAVRAPCCPLLRSLRCPWSRAPVTPVMQAIHVAAQRGNSNAFNALLRNGADLYLKSRVRAARTCWCLPLTDPCARPSPSTRHFTRKRVRVSRTHVRLPGREGVRRVCAPG